MRRALSTPVLLLIVGIGLVAIFYPLFAVAPHISLAEEQKRQRETVAERVRLIGGWDALRRQCDQLLKDNPDGYVYYKSGSGGYGSPLPKSFVPLRPTEVRAHPVSSKSNQPMDVVEIKFYGEHHTGGHDPPYYALWVWDSSTSSSYTPKVEDFPNFASRPFGVILKKLADRVYAVSGKQRR